MYSCKSESGAGSSSANGSAVADSSERLAGIKFCCDAAIWACMFFIVSAMSFNGSCNALPLGDGVVSERPVPDEAELCLSGVVGTPNVNCCVG